MQAEGDSQDKYIDAVKDKVKAKVSEGQRRTARHCNASSLSQRLSSRLSGVLGAMAQYPNLPLDELKLKITRMVRETRHVLPLSEYRVSSVPSHVRFQV
jgi:hypothetical protein